jgi:hypothetical protein
MKVKLNLKCHDICFRRFHKNNKSTNYERQKFVFIVNSMTIIPKNNFKNQYRKSQISGTGNFRDWFHFDLDRPKKNNAIVLETNFKIYKRLWVTPERHGEFLKILKNLLS